MRSKVHTRDFGVLEIILSVALIAVFSLFVLRLFVAASKDRQHMLELDTADCAAVSIIEQFKAGATPYALCATLGGGPEKGAYKRRASITGGMTADVRVQKDSGTDGLYTIRVTVRSSSGETVYTLDGAKAFAPSSAMAKAGESNG